MVLKRSSSTPRVMPPLASTISASSASVGFLPRARTQVPRSSRFSSFPRLAKVLKQVSISLASGSAPSPRRARARD
ncbi:MAG: hypothetical protein Q8P67_25500 [archaeon]|nr:hypothetical protein [archaeon]